MANLVDEFFKRNLSEAESKALEELLGRSPEDALKFAQKLQGEYLAMGLTVPQVPKHFAPMASKGTGAAVKTLLALVTLAGTGTAAWWLWHSHASPVLPPLKPAIVQSLARPKAHLPPPPVEVPHRLDASAEEGNRLSVVVELDRPAPVWVSIVDSHDRQVRDLYQGDLQKGKWSIRWDGLLSDGSRAPAGDYLILVKSGSTQMSKKVSLEAGK